jgi:hypothetical protein
VIFQRRCLSLCWIFRLHKSFQSAEERGEGKGRGLSISNADFTMKLHMGDGVQISLSGDGL